MQLPKLVDWSRTMEALHDIQHVSRGQGCSITIVVVIEVLVRELLIQHFFKFLDKLSASPGTS